MKRSGLIIVILAWCAVQSFAAVRVVTSLPDLADLTRQVGRDRVEVDHIVRGNQNPHFVEVKPSYMLKLKSADLFLLIGMELERWAPQLVDGSRNASLRVVDLSEKITKREVPLRLDASQGDVHRFGNPHYWLDPRNVRIMVEQIVDALTASAPEDEPYFRANAAEFLKRLEARIAGWEALMKPLAGSRIITFHRSWSYFAEWLGLVVVDQVEPKPGIPPSPSHTAKLIELVRKGGIKAIVVEPFYDLSAPERIARATDASVVRLTTSVEGVPQATDYVSMMEYNVSTIAAVLGRDR